MPKYIVVMLWGEEEEPEIKVVESESIDEVLEEYEHNLNNLIVVEASKKVRQELQKPSNVEP
jgi:hypothetical protein